MFTNILDLVIDVVVDVDLKKLFGNVINDVKYGLHTIAGISLQALSQRLEEEQKCEDHLGYEFEIVIKYFILEILN